MHPTTRPTAAPEAEIDALAGLLRGRPFTVLAGAGLSTESGIPDYRSPRSTPLTHRPIQHDEFVRDAAARQRYWARSAVGYARVARARPNAGHRALAEMEARGAVAGVITQNVDGLHHAAGSQRVVELHGALRRVRCLGCGALTSRDALQTRIAALNPRHLAAASPEAPTRPDGDVALAGVAVGAFRVPGCEACGGVLMPDVVFFGGSVPKPTVQAAWDLYGAGAALLVVGSSLSVFSGYRFVLRAEKEAKPAALVTLGPTRADAQVRLKVEAPLGLTLTALAQRLR